MTHAEIEEALIGHVGRDIAEATRGDRDRVMKWEELLAAFPMRIVPALGFSIVRRPISAND